MEWQEKAKTDARNAKIKKFSIWGGVILIFLVVAFVLVQVVATPAQPTQNVTIRLGTFPKEIQKLKLP